jgi:putative DNA primase/helicase
MSRAAFDLVRAAARGRWLAILPEIIGPDYLTGKNTSCPGCGGSDRYQFNRRSESGAFSCRHHPSGGGDGFALIQHVLGCEFTTAVSLVSKALGMADRDGAGVLHAAHFIPRPALPAVDWSKAKASARRAWHESRQITPADAAGLYLLRRGLAIPDDADALRFHAALPYWKQGEDGKPEFVAKLPALVARIARPDGMGCGLHRIYLEPDGRKFTVDGLPAKKILKAGDLTGCAVRLGKAIDDRLAISEGIETALAFSLLSGVCTWAALSSSLMPAVWLPDTAKRIYITADNDEAGLRAAAKLASRLLIEGRDVWINTPPTGNDWNDHLLNTQGACHAA